MNPEKCCHRGHPNCDLSPRLILQRDMDRKEPCWGSQHIRPYGQDSLLEILSHAVVSKALLLLGIACSTAIGKVLSELGRKLLGSSAGNYTNADSPGLVLQSLLTVRALPQGLLCPEPESTPTKASREVAEDEKLLCFGHIRPEGKGWPGCRPIPTWLARGLWNVLPSN